jgi:hypothetical protein
MKVINITKRFKQVNSYDAARYREIFDLHIVIQAEDDRDREWLNDESACWSRVSTINDPDIVHSDVVDVLSSDGYVRNESLLQRTPKPDIFVFSEDFVATPAVLGILTELDMIRWSGQAFPGNVIPKETTILDLLKALENFTY